MTSSNYKLRLVSLGILPLMMQLEINDVMFCVKSLKESSGSFNIHNFIQFCTSGTRASTYHKMRQPSMRTNTVRHFYFNRLPHLWNSLPSINIEHPLSSIKRTLNSHFWDHFLANFNPDFPCTYLLMSMCKMCSYQSL